jgi:hypothetical protein
MRLRSPPSFHRLSLSLEWFPREPPLSPAIMDSASFWPVLYRILELNHQLEQFPIHSVLESIVHFQALKTTWTHFWPHCFCPWTAASFVPPPHYYCQSLATLFHTPLSNPRASSSPSSWRAPPSPHIYDPQRHYHCAKIWCAQIGCAERPPMPGCTGA